MKNLCEFSGSGAYHAAGRRGAVLILCLGCFAATRLAQAESPVASNGVQNLNSGPQAIAQPLDRIEIEVRREPELSNVYSVSPSGTIDFPLIGEVQVSGRQASEVAGEIEKRLTVYLRRPEVDVKLAPAEIPAPAVSEPIRSPGAATVYISGAVLKPGAYSMSESTSALQLIIRAGGLDGVTDPASGGSAAGESAKVFPDLKRVSIVSAQGEVEIVDLSGMGQEDLALHPLKPGDTVIVPGHTGGTFAIYGWVSRPGVYSLSQPILLTEALAQGVPDDRFADLARVKIIRGDPKNPEAFTINVDRLHMRKEVELLPVVRPGDTIYVPRNLFSRLPFAHWLSATTRAR